MQAYVTKPIRNFFQRTNTKSQEFLVYKDSRAHLFLSHLDFHFFTCLFHGHISICFPRLYPLRESKNVQ